MHRRTKVSHGLLLAFGSLAITAPQVLAQQQLERVEITGSAVRRIQAETALPVQIIKREDIERTGATSVADLIQQLPSMQGFINEGSSVGGGGNGFSGASIHNLGETRTLVLLNGRRLATFAGQYLTGGLAGIDLNTIPIAAIERIEILTDGASALYGADAIAGVVNFITKKNFTDGDVNVGFSSPSGGARESRVSLSKGFGNLDKDGFNVMVGANMEKRTVLKATQRDFAKTGVINFELNGRNVSFFNGSPRGIPGNADIDGSGTLINPYLAQNGVCPPEHVQLEQACYYDYVTQLEIMPERERSSVLAQGSLKLAGNHTAFAEALFSTTKNTNRLAPPPGEILITPSSPFYPTVAALGATGDVVVSYRVADVGKRTQIDEDKAQHLVLGVEGALAGWDYHTSFTHSVNKFDTSLDGGYVKLNAILTALGSGLINPFVLPGNQSAAAMDALNASKIVGFWEGGESTLDMFSLRGSRELAQLPGGPLALALGVSHGKEKFEKTASELARGIGDTRFGDTSAIVPYGANRKATGVFAEAVAPVIKSLELTGSVRQDDYSDFGNATTWKLAARYNPTSALLLRGSVGTGFKAPTVPQINAALQEFGVTSGSYTCAPGSQLAAVAAALGAFCQNSPVQYNVYAGGNRDLKPEESKQWTVGFRVEPTSDVSFGMDLWQVHLKNEIGQVDEATIFGAPLQWQSLFTTYVDPGTNQTRLAQLAGNANLGERIERGLDLDGKVRFGTPMGRLTTSLGLTYWIKNKYQLEIGGPFLTSLGKFGPDGDVTFRWQGRATAVLEQGNFTHTLGVNFKSGYKDQTYTAADFAVFDPVTFDSFDYAGEVKRYATLDWQTNWKVNKSISITAGILNVFDTDPPRSLKSSGGGQMIGYDDRYYDPRGRTFYGNLSFKF